MRTYNDHRHRSDNYDVAFAFVRCVVKSGHPCHPEAHGNITWHQRCNCGATKEVNVNNSFREQGAWVEVRDDTANLPG